MLQRKTVEPDTLSLIYDLQSKRYTSDFLLVGGTALALQIGHHTSTDIDLFSTESFDVDSLLIQLQGDFDLSIRSRMTHALLLDINHIKTDFVFQLPAGIFFKIIKAYFLIFGPKLILSH